LIKAGEALEQAQRDAMSGAGSDFDTARRDEAAAIRRLRDAAEELMPSATTATLDRVARTLTAAAASSEGRALLKQGRLTEDLEPPGFEALAGVALQPKQTKKRRAPSAQASRRIETLRRRKQETDEDAEQKAGEARELERAAREAEQAAKKAARAAASARKKADAAAAQAERLEAELAELEERG
jgi:hypothetical protein